MIHHLYLRFDKISQVVQEFIDALWALVRRSDIESRGASASEVEYRRFGLQHHRSENQKSWIESLRFRSEGRDIDVTQVME